jgi:hypothetical protein
VSDRNSGEEVGGDSADVPGSVSSVQIKALLLNTSKLIFCAVMSLRAGKSDLVERRGHVQGIKGK